MSLKVRFRQDYPPRTEVIESLKTSSSVADLLLLAKQRFERDEEFMGYGVVVAAGYGSDVVQIDLRELSATVSDLGLVDHMTVCFFVSNALKPKQAEKKQEEEEEEDDSIEEEGKFKGFSAKYCVRDFGDAKKDKKELRLEYILQQADCLISEDYYDQVNNLRASDLKLILEQDKLELPEAELLAALIRWGMHRRSESQKLKEIVSPLLTEIRIPLLDATAVATSLIPSNILEEGQILDLFTYIGRRGKLEGEAKDIKEALAAVSVPESLKMFSCNLRSGTGSSWVFESKGASTIAKMSKGNKMITHTGNSNQWSSVRVKKWIKANTGKHTIKFKIIQNQTTHWIFLGFVYESFSMYDNTSSGYVGHSSSTGSGWTSASNGTRYGSTSGTYGPSKTPAYGNGDIVIMTVDSGKKTVSFAIKDASGKKDYGEAFTNVQFPLSPAVTLYDTGDCVQLL